MRVSNGSATLLLVAVLATVSIMGQPAHDARGQAQGSSFTLSSGTSTLGERAADALASDSWSNATFICTINTTGVMGSGR